MVSRFDRYVLDPQNMRLTANGENRALEPKSLRLLEFLIENRDRVVPKEEILSVVWEGAAVSDNALTRAVAQIRKALDDDAKQPRYVSTVPTVGYRFDGKLMEPAEALPAKPLPAAAARQLPSRWIATALAAIVAIVAGGVWLLKRRSQSAPRKV